MSNEKKGLIFNYIRVSTCIQNTARQLEGVYCDREYLEKISGRNRNRPELKKMLEMLRGGDIVNVHSIDRLARSNNDLRNIVEEILSKGASINFIKQNLSFEPDNKASPMSKVIFGMLSVLAEFEVDITNERVAEGKAAAKSRGVKFGRKPNLDLHAEIKKLVESGVSVRKTAKELGCCESTVKRVKKTMVQAHETAN